MKNKAYKILSKLLVVVVSSLLFTSFSPSLDGRAVVVEDGVFPQGLFAKTVGYLPGDTISVTNVAGDSSVDLLVIGSLDPSEGVAIMLTPEAAAAIGIDKSENNIVKITKRSGLDERVYGNAIITKSDELPIDQNIQEESKEIVEDEYDVEYNPADYHEEYVEDEESEEVVEDEYDVEYNPADYHEEYVEDEESEEVVDDEYDVEYNPADYHEEYVEDEDAEEDEYDVEYNPADYHEEYVEDEEIEEEFVSDEELEDFVTEEFVEDEALEDELEANPVEEEIIEQVTEEIIEEEMLEDFEESEDVPAEEITEENLESEEVPVEQEFVETDELDNLEEESNIEEVIEEDFAETDEIVEEEYEAIVLVPVESNPPVVEADEEEVVLVEDLESIVAVAEDTTEIEAVEEVSEAISLPEEPVKVVEEIKIEVEQTSTSAIGYEKYIVPSLNDLESGKYYIQIASLRDDKNIEEIISKYANNYPIAIVPKKAGNIKQILVGPLSMDEYGVVLQRFKSYGYKDAFLRKIK